MELTLLGWLLFEGTTLSASSWIGMGCSVSSEHTKHKVQGTFMVISTVLVSPFSSSISVLLVN